MQLDDAAPAVAGDDHRLALPRPAGARARRRTRDSSPPACARHGCSPAASRSQHLHAGHQPQVQPRRLACSTAAPATPRRTRRRPRARSGAAPGRDARSRRGRASRRAPRMAAIHSGSALPHSPRSPRCGGCACQNSRARCAKSSAPSSARIVGQAVAERALGRGVGVGTVGLQAGRGRGSRPHAARRVAASKSRWRRASAASQVRHSLRSPRPAAARRPARLAEQHVERRQVGVPLDQRRQRRRGGAAHARRRPTRRRARGCRGRR